MRVGWSSVRAAGYSTARVEWRVVWPLQVADTKRQPNGRQNECLKRVGGFDILCSQQILNY